jgi:4-hydroxybenzoate polyprenyltransferase
MAVIHYFKIIRPLNLGIIVLTQLLLRFCIVEVYLGLSMVDPAMGYLDFTLLVLATVLIAAGGYVINDLFDQEVDKTNKPGKIIIGHPISRSSGWKYYGVLTTVGCFIGFYLALQINYYVLGFIFPAVAGLLYLYSAKYQKTIITGNAMIALLSAMVILVLWLFEFFALKNDPIRFVDAMKQLPVLQVIVACYALFAFLVSMSREIVKDIEDHKGDEKEGYRTLVVVFGLKTGKRLAVAVHLLTMLLLVASLLWLFREGLMMVFWYLLVAVTLLFIYSLYQLLIARVREDFRFLSNAYKLIMLAGILSMELFYISY